MIADTNQLEEGKKYVVKFYNKNELCNDCINTSKFNGVYSLSTIAHHLKQSVFIKDENKDRLNVNQCDVSEQINGVECYFGIKIDMLWNRYKFIVYCTIELDSDIVQLG